MRDPDRRNQEKQNPIVLVGAGGHCKACVDVIEQEGRFRIAGLVDVKDRLHKKVLGYEIIATDEDLPRLVDEYPYFLITIGQVRSAEKRIRLFDFLRKLGAAFPVIISPYAYVSKHASMGKGTIVMHQALVDAGAQIGVNCVINSNAIVEHDAEVSNHCLIGVGEVVNAKRKIQNGTFFRDILTPQHQIEISNSSIAEDKKNLIEASSTLQSSQKAKLAVFGASGFSRETADILLGVSFSEVIYIDLNPVENTYFGFPLVSEQEIPRLQETGFQFAIGLGNNKDRKRIYEKFAYLPFPNIIHPSASIGFNMSKTLVSTKGNIIGAGVRLTNNIQIGNFGIFNLNCTVGHDCMIKDFVNIAPGANVSGNVFLAEGVYVGSNATILQGRSIENKIEIGRFATVGAGAVVTKNVHENTTVVGIPARNIKTNVAGRER